MHVVTEHTGGFHRDNSLHRFVSSRCFIIADDIGSRGSARTYSFSLSGPLLGSFFHVTVLQMQRNWVSVINRFPRLELTIHHCLKNSTPECMQPEQLAPEFSISTATINLLLVLNRVLQHQNLVFVSQNLPWKLNLLAGVTFGREVDDEALPST